MIQLKIVNWLNLQYKHNLFQLNLTNLPRPKIVKIMNKIKITKVNPCCFKHTLLLRRVVLVDRFLVYLPKPVFIKKTGSFQY